MCLLCYMRVLSLEALSTALGSVYSFSHIKLFRCERIILFYINCLNFKLSFTLKLLQCIRTYDAQTAALSTISIFCVCLRLCLHLRIFVSLLIVGCTSFHISMVLIYSKHSAFAAIRLCHFQWYSVIGIQLLFVSMPCMHYYIAFSIIIIPFHDLVELYLLYSRPKRGNCSCGL